MTAILPPLDQTRVDTQQRAAPAHDAAPLYTGDSCGHSYCSIKSLHGEIGATIWCIGDTECDAEGEVQLKLAPDCPVVIGRSSGHVPPYLDPAYRPTQIVPGSSTRVVNSHCTGKDVAVSRAHFMLRGHSMGILLTNGVPHVNGGIRPPLNGTWMGEGQWRKMIDGEEYLIEHGLAATIYLPNHAVVRISAA